MKKRVDDNFKKDLYKYCSGFSGIWSYKGVECRRIADLYVAAVRKFGKREDVPGFSKREGSVLDIELDDDIEGQEIPPVLEDDGIEVDDLEAYLSE